MDSYKDMLYKERQPLVDALIELPDHSAFVYDAKGFERSVRNFRASLYNLLHLKGYRLSLRQIQSGEYAGYYFLKAVKK